MKLRIVQPPNTPQGEHQRHPSSDESGALDPFEEAQRTFRKYLPAPFRIVQARIFAAAAPLVATAHTAEAAMAPVAVEDPAAAGTVLGRPTHCHRPFDL